MQARYRACIVKTAIFFKQWTNISKTKKRNRQILLRLGNHYRFKALHFAFSEWFGLCLCTRNRNRLCLLIRGRALHLQVRASFANFRDYSKWKDVAGCACKKKASRSTKNILHAWRVSSKQRIEVHNRQLQSKQYLLRNAFQLMTLNFVVQQKLHHTARDKILSSALRKQFLLRFFCYWQIYSRMQYNCRSFVSQTSKLRSFVCFSVILRNWSRVILLRQRKVQIEFRIVSRRIKRLQALIMKLLYNMACLRKEICRMSTLIQKREKIKLISNVFFVAFVHSKETGAARNMRQRSLLKLAANVYLILWQHILNRRLFKRFKTKLQHKTKQILWFTWITVLLNKKYKHCKFRKCFSQIVKYTLQLSMRLWCRQARFRRRKRLRIANYNQHVRFLTFHRLKRHVRLENKNKLCRLESIIRLCAKTSCRQISPFHQSSSFGLSLLVSNFKQLKRMIKKRIYHRYLIRKSQRKLRAAVLNDYMCRWHNLLQQSSICNSGVASLSLQRRKKVLSDTYLSWFDLICYKRRMQYIQRRMCVRVLRLVCLAAVQDWKLKVALMRPQHLCHSRLRFSSYDSLFLSKCWCRWLVVCQSQMSHRLASCKSAISFFMQNAALHCQSVVRLNIFQRWHQLAPRRQAARHVLKLAAQAAARIQLRQTFRAWSRLTNEPKSKMLGLKHTTTLTKVLVPAAKDSFRHANVPERNLGDTAEGAGAISHGVTGGRHIGRALSYQRRRKDHNSLSNGTSQQDMKAGAHECLGNSCWICLSAL